VKERLLSGRCIKLTRADFDAGSGGDSEAVSDLWAWLQHNESVTINAKQSGYVLCAAARLGWSFILPSFMDLLQWHAALLLLL